MICYRDTTFCMGDGCVSFNDCSRALTPAIRAKAAIWWGGDDASIAFFESPKDLDCYKSLQEEKPTTTTHEKDQHDNQNDSQEN
jgi:hypothetical protein